MPRGLDIMHLSVIFSPFLCRKMRNIQKVLRNIH